MTGSRHYPQYHWANPNLNSIRTYRNDSDTQGLPGISIYQVCRWALSSGVPSSPCRFIVHTDLCILTAPRLRTVHSLSLSTATLISCLGPGSLSTLPTVAELKKLYPLWWLPIFKSNPVWPRSTWEGRELAKSCFDAVFHISS